MSVAGVDFSSHAIDVVLLHDDSDQAEWHRFPMEGENPFRRARSLRTVFPTRSWWEDNGVWLLGIEDPHSRANHTAKALGLAAGAVAALLPHDLCVIQTPPAEWKRVYCGASNADKATVKATGDLRLLLSLDMTLDWPQDAYDALGIAWAVRALNDKAIQNGAAA